MTDTLVVLLDSRRIGEITRRDGRLRFIYHTGWRHDPEAYPLSLSMPLERIEHDHEVVDAFLWGLLPDNEHVLARWGRRYQASARNAFSLLAHVGEDCAGAVQLLAPDRAEAVGSAPGPPMQWLDEAEIETRLRDLRTDAAAGRRLEDAGQFSLAGAQPKTALAYVDGRWGIPAGRVPTTHILKPPTAEFDGHAENEHFCLALARDLGLPAAKSEIRRFGDEVAIVVERYDRLRLADRIARIHQEDMCQALGVLPTQKYENVGGPDAASIVDLLRRHSSRPDEDVARFIDALAFNWLIAGTDAHAKNYAVLIAGGRQVRLAPLYDLASALPYFDPQRLKLAMKIGGHYGIDDILGRHWRRLLNECDLDPAASMERILRLTLAMEGALTSAVARIEVDGLDTPIVHTVAAQLANRRQACQQRLKA